ncbi:related to cytochrome P450 monooxygenase (lovA) [Cephalotrichum gorgonifer]|uniref:Related to cytochrome P450 monooxygenase (LovA) n=1 Tax=Cephalotrichum gorgonifer TaxID=2041049 RepID=A0AAE8MSD0_9PEZI|nr:related to cytochrome P450 monooxygenase (lovA) [Cephalotrichum gorgonifer]
MSTTIDLQLPSAVVGGKNLTYYVAVGSVLFLAWAWRNRNPRSVDAPFYEAPNLKWMFDAESLILDSYSKFRNKVYQIKATEGVQVLIPANLIGELKGLPEEVLSSTEAVSEALLTKYTHFCPGHNGDLLATLVRKQLTQSLTRLVPQLKEELEHITATEFPECKDWAPVKFHPFGLRAVARMSGRAFVGAEINRREQWMDTSINFATHVFAAVVKLQHYPPWLRPIGQHLVPEIRQIRRDIAVGEALLRPVILERLRDMEEPGYEGPEDLTQWLIEGLSEGEKGDLYVQTKLQLILAAASIHTTNNLLTECMYDLAAHPEVQEMLREEAYQVLEVEGGWEKKESLAKLKKLDSFMKEVQRINGNITSFIRKVVKPVTLSNGTHLPPGTKLLAPQAGFSRDADYFPDPSSFDPLRFYDMRRKSAEDSNRWQFTSISDSNLNFGAGRHACPGRFFAGNEIKLALSFFLLNYEVRLPEGAERPRPMVIVMSKMPDMNAELLFRRRTMMD